jgi:tRNA-specific 2-thiouridylase
LEARHLSKLILPLGDIIKKNILPPSESGYKESQDICFIPKDYREFLNDRKVNSPKGFFKDSFGNIVGEHNGIINYTRGQRKGLGVALGYPAFVTDINVEKNIITLGRREELTVHSFKVNKLNFQAVEMFSGEREFYVKTRYRAKPRKANVRIDSGIATVELAEGDDLVTAGQSAVFYDGDNVAFGGEIIEESIK